MKMSGEYIIVFSIIAIVLSAYWGVVGFSYARDEECKKWVCKSSYFVSDFLVSLAGWLCLFVLIETYADANLSNFNVFLGIVAFMGITGYGFELAKYFSNKLDKK